jgi:hypothetical protein
MALGDLNYQRERGAHKEDIADTRGYEEKLYNRGRTDKLSDIEAEHKYNDIVRKDTQGFQVSQQDRQFAQQFQMQKQSQSFQAGQQARQQEFAAGENEKERAARLQQLQNKPSAGMSVAAQKELFDTEDAIHGSKAAVKSFQEALKINKQAMGGYGSGALATAGGILPEAIRPATVDATKELDNILQGSALPQLKAIFGGMPTEGERAILLEVQGSSAQPASVREGIFKRAMDAANTRIKINEQKAKQLRSGTYFTESGGVNIPEENNMQSPVIPSQDAIAAELARRRKGK